MELAKKMEKWGSKALASIGSPVAFDIRNPLVADWLDGFRSVTLKDINATTASSIRDVIEAGVEQGLGIDELARQIGGVFDEARGYRAERIARTETGSAMNAANLSAYQISGMVDEKEWLATQDESTRETHSQMDGDVVPIMGTFTSPSGAKAQAPGQFGVAEEDLQCRCTIIPKVHMKGVVGAERVAVWRAFDDEVESESKLILKAFQAAFSTQEGIVLEALRRAA